MLGATLFLQISHELATQAVIALLRVNPNKVQLHISYLERLIFCLNLIKLWLRFCFLKIETAPDNLLRF